MTAKMTSERSLAHIQVALWGIERLLDAWNGVESQFPLDLIELKLALARREADEIAKSLSEDETTEEVDVLRESMIETLQRFGSC